MQCLVSAEMWGFRLCFNVKSCCSPGQSPVSDPLSSASCIMDFQACATMPSQACAVKPSFQPQYSTTSSLNLILLVCVCARTRACVNTPVHVCHGVCGNHMTICFPPTMWVPMIKYMLLGFTALLASSMSTWHKLESLWKREPQLRKCSYQTGLWASL